jgi:hypothetical protein
MIEAHPWLAFGAAILATWRVSHLLAREDGPFHLLARLRARLGNGLFGTLMDCFACLSLWIAAPIAYLVSHDWRTWVLLWLGLSGGACLIERASEKPVVFQPLPETSIQGDSHELLRTTENRPPSGNNAAADTGREAADRSP